MTNTLFDQVRALVTEHHLMEQLILRAKLDLIAPFALSVLFGIVGVLLRRKALVTRSSAEFCDRLDAANDRFLWNVFAVVCGAASAFIMGVVGAELVAILATPEAYVLYDLLKGK